ncbi:hypothetical protein GOP47_0020298 [Adiantum capillus-veneris]|uniref:Pentatricopeptide repeat-containing protein n=1 Tax=Adiantum capillus-veneris TaxID=13818 RepID=A0A9D4Z7X1_ADICA|nr:hypothetical protein GOP47_0020298 [Adiantum capillus-veneris]
MSKDGWKPEIEDITRLLKACANIADLDRTKQLHSHVIELGFDIPLQVNSTLVHSYMRCGSVQNACSVFNSVRKRDVILWTTLITGYAQLGLCGQAFASFNRMYAEGESPNQFTYASILKACPNRPNRGLVKHAHTGLLESGFGPEVTIGNALIDAYGKIGNMDHALAVFNNMHRKDVVSWSAMIYCFGQYERWRDAIVLFKEMNQEQLQPNNYVYVSILKACASLKDLETCRHVHSQVVERSWEVDVYLRTTLLDTYMKCGCIKDVQEVLEKIVNLDLMSVNVMLSGYAQHALGEEANALFLKSQNEGLIPDKFTFATMLKACASVACIEEGTHFHARLSSSGIACDPFMASTLIDMYVKCSRIDYARQVFDGMFERDLILWNSLLVGFIQAESCENAMGLYHQMQLEGVFADACTYVILLKACIGIAALVSGKQIHARLVKSSVEPNLYVRSSLVDMYSKCGSLESAREVFESTQDRDVISWNSVITAYAQQGHSKEVFTLFESMKEEGLKPSVVTLGCVLSACRHSGLVEDGCEYLKSLVVTYNIEPSGEHFGCIIDLFARVGRLNEAADFLSKFPFKLTVEPWIALLAACKVHGDVDVAERAFENVERLEPDHVGSVILLSNVYSAAKKWDAANSMRLRLKAKAMEGPEEQHELSGPMQVVSIQ